MQLVSAMELLVSHVQLWSASLQDMDSTTILQLTAAIQASVKDLGTQMVTFLQVSWLSWFLLVTLVTVSHLGYCC